MSERGDSPNCLNCGAELKGQYCGQCGQRATARFISLFELLRDAFGDLFELDSRLWRTLLPLLRKPGLLTKDYLEGKRARYMPPFRMYLVLSLIFFAVAFFDPRGQLAILFEAPTDVATDLTDPAGVSQEDVDASTQDEDVADDEQGDGVNITFDDDTGAMSECSLGNTDMSDAPEWIQKRFTPERLNAACERLKSAGLKGLADAIVENIPAALIILLPFMAFVLKTLYPLSRRYYVEHLLFFVHFHAFFFLILTLQILLARIGGWIGFAEGIFTLVIVVASLYIPVYLYVAMRRVYGQGRVLTLLKYLWLAGWYLVGFTFVLLGAVLIAVFSI